MGWTDAHQNVQLPDGVKMIFVACWPRNLGDIHHGVGDRISDVFAAEFLRAQLDSHKARRRGPVHDIAP